MMRVYVYLVLRIVQIFLTLKIIVYDIAQCKI